jgi:DNA-binding protein HU-beta
MTKAELITEIALNTGYDKKTISVITEALMDKIKSNMAKGKNVYMRGFGSFVVKPRKEKIARNITKRTTVYVPAHCVPSFKPAKEFNDAVHDLKLKNNSNK